MKFSKESGLKKIDLFGTTGDPNGNYKNLVGIHNYKKNYGGKYVEFIGEFDYIYNNFMYKLLPIVLKAYRKLLRFKRKIK